MYIANMYSMHGVDSFVKKIPLLLLCILHDYFALYKIFHCINIYVSLCLRVQNVVPAQPCVGKLGISLVLLNFLHCNFR